MARRRTTFGKLERDRAKQAKARAKVDRRAALRSGEETPDEEEPPRRSTLDPDVALAKLAELQEALEAGKLSFDEFESRRAELARSLDLG